MPKTKKYPAGNRRIAPLRRRRKTNATPRAAGSKLLTEWFDENPAVTKTAFATAVGLSKQHVSNLANGRIKPSLAAANAIERETGGAVTAQDWG